MFSKRWWRWCAVGEVDRLAVLDPLRDDEGRVEQRHGEHEQRQHERREGGGLQHALHGDGREREPEQQRAGVAHEDPRRIEVVAQEAEAGAEHDRRQDRRVRTAEREVDQAERERRDRADAGGEAVQPVEEVDHVHHRDDREHRERDAEPRRHSCTPTNGNVKRCTQTPKPTGIEAASTWPASFSHQRRPRKSSIAPTVVATAAPSRIPRISPPSGRNASDGTKMPRKSARPPSRGTPRGARPAPVLGAVDDAEQTRHPADRRREQRRRRRARRARPRRPRGCSVSSFQTIGALLLRPVEAVARVAEAGDDVALLVQVRVDRRRRRCARRGGRARCARRPRARRSARSA